MARRLQLRRGSTSQHNSFTGAIGEVTVDTSKKTLVVHDGLTQGGIPLAKESSVTNISNSIDSVNLLRADRYLALQDIANMVYTSGDLIKIQYNNATDVDYEVFAYGNGNLTSIKHYVGSVLRGTTTLSYTSRNLVSAIFVGV